MISLPSMKDFHSFICRLWQGRVDAVSTLDIPAVAVWWLPRSSSFIALGIGMP